MHKREAKNNIKNLDILKEYKLIAEKIIDNAPDDQYDLRGYYDFIINRVGFGLKFDISPELSNGNISYISQIDELCININSLEEGPNENKIIIGENYGALKNLILTHKEKIDIIYIDPPYNTETAQTDNNSSNKSGENKKFIYKDKFGRNAWLNLMRDRIYLASKLLSTKGYIFISIDDTEQEYLKILCDEFFTFVALLPRETSSFNSNSKNLINSYDFVLVFTNKKNSSWETDFQSVDIGKNKVPEFLFKGDKYKNKNGTLALKKLNLEFSNPKPVELIEKIIQLVPNNKNSIILDFFAGSGTTGQSVLSLNKKDNGNRTFILCTNDENKIASKIMVPRFQRLILPNNEINLKNNELFEDVKVRVFSLKQKFVSKKANMLNQTEDIELEAKRNLKLLSSSYDVDAPIDIYYDLSGINLIKETDLKEEK